MPGTNRDTAPRFLRHISPRPYQPTPCWIAIDRCSGVNRLPCSASSSVLIFDGPAGNFRQPAPGRQADRWQTTHRHAGPAFPENHVAGAGHQTRNCCDDSRRNELAFRPATPDRRACSSRRMRLPGERFDCLFSGWHCNHGSPTQVKGMVMESRHTDAPGRYRHILDENRIPDRRICLPQYEQGDAPYFCGNSEITEVLFRLPGLRRFLHYWHPFCRTASAKTGSPKTNCPSRPSRLFAATGRHHLR